MEQKQKARGQGDPAPETTVYAVVEEPVRDKKGKKKKKRGSSRAARRLEDIESRVSKSVNRVSKGVNQGVVLYRDKRDKSARKRRDGALTDFGNNVARGVSKAVRKSSPAVIDVAKAMNTRRLRKRVRRGLRGVPVIG